MKWKNKDRLEITIKITDTDGKNFKRHLKIDKKLASVIPNLPNKLEICLDEPKDNFKAGVVYGLEFAQASLEKRFKMTFQEITEKSKMDKDFAAEVLDFLDSIKDAVDRELDADE